MLQKVLQFSRILRWMDQNWYIGEDMNGKQLSKFSSVEDGGMWKYMQKTWGYFFWLTLYIPAYGHLSVY